MFLTGGAAQKKEAPAGTGPFSMTINKLSLLLLCGLAGCGNYFSVRVPHQVPEMPGAAAARPALSALYLTIRTAPPAEENALGALAGALGARQAPEFRPSELARHAARALARPASRVCAWRVAKAGAEDPFAAALKPSGLLVIEAASPSASARKEERSAVHYEKGGKKQTVKTAVQVYSASLYAGIKLYSWPAMAQLDAWSDNFSYTEERRDASADPADWYAANEGRLFGAVAAKLAARYAGRPLERLRPVFLKKGDKESEEAGRLAQRGRWDQAEEIWLRRAAAEGGWREYLGLAVSAEVKKDYAAAAAHYRQAQARGAGDKDAARIFWGQIYSDLETASSTAAAADCGSEWFAEKTALLPFSDETTSVDGPPMVRQLVYESLKAAGYSLVPLEQTDEALKRRGYSEGGQLTAAKPAELAGWLGAGRLVYGDLTDFAEVMAGVYNRRMIKGSARVWSPGRELVFEESVVNVKTPKSFLGGLAGQLAKGLAERIRNKPLAEEAAKFSRQVSENLPNRP